MLTIKRLLAAGALLTITALGVAACGSSKANTATTASTALPASAFPGTAPPMTTPATTPTTAEPVATKPKPKQWTTVIKVSGTSDKRTPLFTLHGGQTRLRYTFTDTSGFGAMIGAIYVLDEGTSLAADGGVPEVMVSDAGSDSTELQQGAGRYYLDISAASARWTVTIQELR